jgi:hypothetical protein
MTQWKNEMAEMSWLCWLTFDGVRSGEDVSAPTLMVHSDGCVFPEHAKAVYAALKGRSRSNGPRGAKSTSTIRTLRSPAQSHSWRLIPEPPLTSTKA